MYADSVSLVLHSFDRGGSGRVVGFLARGFRDLDLHPQVIVFCRGGAAEVAVERLMGPDIPVQYLRRATGVRGLDLWFGLRALAQALRARRSQVVIAAANNTALITAIAFRLAQVPHSRLYIKSTNPIAKSRHRGLARRLRLFGYRIAFRWASGVWTLSEEEQADMKAEFPEYSNLFRTVINPYVTPEMLSDAPLVAARIGGPKTVITIGRLTKQKRLDRLIHAFAQLRDREVKLLILGEGEERRALENLIDNLHIQGRVSMPGQVTDVASFLRSSDLFVLASDYEGLPAAVLEAMAVNCPVLATDCFPSARSLLAHEGCGIFENVDPTAMAQKIIQHLEISKPYDLRERAKQYSIDKGVSSHFENMNAVSRYPERTGIK